MLPEEVTRKEVEAILFKHRFVISKPLLNLVQETYQLIEELSLPFLVSEVPILSQVDHFADAIKMLPAVHVAVSNVGGASGEMAEPGSEED